MNETYITGIPVLIAVLFMFFAGLIIPYLTRKELVFGIRIPWERRDDEELKKIRNMYTKNYLISVGLISVVLLYLLFARFHGGIVAAGFILVFFAFITNYLVCHKAVKKLKADNNWTIGKKEVVVVDLNYRDKKLLVPAWWFIIPFVFIIAQIVLGILQYESLPDKLVVHWDIAGTPDKWADKSWKQIFMLPGTCIFTSMIMIFVYKVIEWSKQQLSAGNPELTKIQSQMFRKRWSGFVVFMNIAVVLLLSVIYLQLIEIIVLEGYAFAILVSVFMAAVMGVTGYLAISHGQGGSRLKIPEAPDDSKGQIDRNDDRFWKWGIIYINPGDPAMFLEKRFGIGWTINFGNPKAIIGFAVFIVAIALFSIFFEN